MIYTVGHKVNYDTYFKDKYPEVPLKSGRDSKLHPNYPGGTVWKSYAAARQSCQDGFEVYGVDADWNIHTTPSQDSFNGSRDLLKTSKLIQVPQQESFTHFAKGILKEDDAPKFGCLMAMISPGLSGQFIDWAFDAVDPDDVVPDNGKTGYEDEPHITVMYGFHPDVTHEEVFSYIKDFGPIALTLGKITKFKQDDQDVLKIDVESKDLHEFNALLADKFADRITNDYPDYHPHQTIAYVKKGAAEDIDPETFEGFEMTIDTLMYSYGGGDRKVLLNLEDASLSENYEQAVEHTPENDEPLPAEVDAAFNALADDQRGAPESAMLKATMFHHGVWAFCLEHIGDLTHRMAQNPNFYKGGKEYVNEKVRKCLRYLTQDYGFEKEVKDNLQNNYRVNPQAMSFKQYMAKTYALAKAYSDEHRKLVVYNQAQWLARQAAIEIGLAEFNNATLRLWELEEMLKGDWAQHALTYYTANDKLVPYTPSLTISPVAIKI